MTKGVKIVHLIGYVIETMLSIAIGILFIVSLIIVLPSGREFIIKGLMDGSIHMDPALSIEQNADYIQHLFIYFSIILAFLTAAFIVNTVFSFIISKHPDRKKLIITSLVLSVICFNPLLIIANILLLKNGDVEIIEVN